MQAAKNIVIDDTEIDLTEIDLDAIYIKVALKLTKLLSTKSSSVLKNKLKEKSVLILPSTDELIDRY